MPNTIGRNLNICFSNSKAQSSSSSSKSSFQESRDHSRPFFNATLIKNFNSLYDFTLECTPHSKSFPADDDKSEPGAAETSSATPDLATALASRRFFFSSPGRSNSIIDSSSTSSSRASTSSSSPTAPPPENRREPDALVDGSVAIPTESPDPFLDFRRSMQEMVEARQIMDVRANWDHLHELLTCYLTLNPKSAHKFIVGAFADLLVSLMPSPSTSTSTSTAPSQDYRQPESSNRAGTCNNKSKVSRQFL